MEAGEDWGRVGLVGVTAGPNDAFGQAISLCSGQANLDSNFM